MDLDFFQVDAFADTVFTGNPAAVYPLDAWLPAETMQAIAAEHNLSETVFFVPEQEGYHIRWFTPVAEVSLCGHATLAAAHILFTELNPGLNRVLFSSLSGPLPVERDGPFIVLDFPAEHPDPCIAPEGLAEALGIEPCETLRGDDYFVIIEREADLARLVPDLKGLSAIDCRGVCVTAPGETADFVSRFFAPRHGIDEDPVTGSSHCTLAPYWANRLNKTGLQARQLSERGGTLQCTVSGDRVRISGRAVTYCKGRARL